jgi:hypothetical protein
VALDTKAWNIKEIITHYVKRREKFIVLGIVVTIGFSVYYAGLKGSYFADDFKFVFSNPSSKIFYYIFHHNSNLAFYRPIDSSILALIQTYFGMSTLPIHIIILCVHIILSYFLYKVSLGLNFTRLQASLTSLYMLVSQANAFAVLSNDTLSQVGGTLSGFLSLWFFYRFGCSDNKTWNSSQNRPFGLLIISLLFFALSLLFKETSLSFLLATMILAFAISNGSLKYRLQKSFIETIPYLFLTIIYIVVRSSIVVGQPDERYSFILDFTIVKNLAISLLASAIPVSTVKTFVAIQNGNIIFLIALAAISALLWTLVSYGVIKRYSRKLTVLIILVFLMLFPVVFMRHVSELYVYNSMPAISLLFGYGLGTIAAPLLQYRWKQIFLITLLLMLFISHILAIRQKAELLTSNGERASFLLEKIMPYLSKVPERGTLVLLNPADSRVEYSIFLMNGFNVLRYGTNILCQISGRDDIQIWILDDKERGKINIPQDALILSFVNNNVQTITKK